MQCEFFFVVIILTSMDYTGSHVLKGRRQRRISTEVTPVCPKGCEVCSEYNGCLKCLPKLFILLERNDIRQIGICLPSCPPGHFGVRTPEMNKCTKCKIENCEACFSRNFCTKCKDNLYLHRGKCYDSCPEGFAAINGTMECSNAAPCELSEWSAWGPCTKREKLCGFKRGTETRTRQVLQKPASEDVTCPPVRESRICTVQRKPCSSGQGKGNRRRDKQKGGRKGKARNKEGGNRQSKKDSKSGNKKKKGQQRKTLPATTPSTSQ
ncbi:R-spondin-1 [Mobula birostris]|uniref:R-spondin-1 n=1 Tax=Mobula birostris TaxID=1983395 RepID=UPI003B27C25B